MTTSDDLNAKIMHLLNEIERSLVLQQRADNLVEPNALHTADKTLTADSIRERIRHLEDQIQSLKAALLEGRSLLR